MEDTVLFMSAYNITNYKKTNWASGWLCDILSHRKKYKLQTLLEKYHLSFIATEKYFVSSTRKLDVDMQYDSVHQKTSFSFNAKGLKKGKEDVLSDIDNAGFYINLRHAQSVLVDDRFFKIDFTIWMEPFLIWIDGNRYQINAGIFVMNSILFIIFEIINHETGAPLSKDEVCGKIGNYNLLFIDKYCFFGDEQPIIAKKKIPDLIYDIICDFFLKLGSSRLHIKEFAYVYNILVLANNIDNIQDYFCKLMEIKQPMSLINDISTVETYEYYPQEGCSVITKYDQEDLSMVLYSSIMLEAIKLYIYIFQLCNLEDETNIQKTIRNNIYLQNLFCSPDLPIETYNLLDFIKKSESYKKHDEALQLKISYLTAQTESSKGRNAVIMNVLLYIISVFGAIESLNIIEDRFGIPFNISFIIVIALFIFGGIWGIVEYRHNRSL